MRRYDEAIDVRRGLVSGQDAPAQFLWRERLWVVRDIIAHWVETGAWWEQPGVSVLFGGLDASEEPPPQPDDGSARCADLLGEKEIWRVEAMRARAGAGVFDVSFDWTLGQWRLVCCID
jgi:uncharacterized protein DUF6504